MNNEGRKIIGYNPQTGEPIYEQLSNINPQNQQVVSMSNANAGYSQQVQPQVAVTPQPQNQQVVPMSNANAGYSQQVQPQVAVTPQPQNQQAVPMSNANAGYSQQVQPQVAVNPQPMNYKKSKKKNPWIFVGIGLIIVLSIVIVAILLSVGGSKKSSSRTIMIYMVGSDLESRAGLASVDLESIKENPNVKVLLIAGGSEKWYNDYIDISETSIYELKYDGFEKVYTQPQKNMGDEKVFSDFLNYAYENYKSDKYDLIFWNHGGAIHGSEYDDLSGDNLSLKEMSQGLKNSPFNSNRKLEVVIFRTCLNGTLEIANVFDDYAEYLVASEEITYGAQRTNVLGFINRINSSDSAVDLSKKYITSYQNQIADIRNMTSFGGEDSIYSTYSITKLSNIGNLNRAVNDFFSDINSSSSFNTVSRVRANLYQYGSDEPAYDMVDLYNLVYSLRDLSPSKADKVIKEFENTIVYNWATNPSSRGLSIYFPYNGDNRIQQIFLGIYEDFSDLSGYNKFINDFHDMQNSDYERYSYNLNTIKKENVDEYSSDFVLELTDEQVEGFARAKYFVFRDNGNGYYKPFYTGGKAILDGNRLIASVRDRQLRVYSTDDKSEGHILISREIENTDKYIKFQTPVILVSFHEEKISDWKHDSATMNILYDKETKKIAMQSVVYRDDNLSDTIVADLSIYDTVEFSGSSSWQILDEDGNYEGPYDSEGNLRSDGIFTGWEEEPGHFDFELERFDEGYDYYCVFAIYDTHNNVSYSKLIKMN